jgi:hypothetical protein
MNRHVAGALALLAAGGLLAAGCSSDDGEGAITTDDVQVLDATFVPDSLLGYVVEAESTAGIDGVSRSYVDAVRLYSVRDGDQLIATLQVGKFSDGVKWATRSFQRSVLNQIGASSPEPARMGDDTIYLTTGVKQRLAVWFKAGYLFVLGTRDEFTRPRTLLREAVEVTP